MSVSSKVDWTTPYTLRLLDGGFSSQISYHLKMDSVCTDHPLWCARFLLTNPTAVINTHRDYVRVGADIVITNSYQASLEGFEKYLDLSASDSYRLILQSVRFVKEAIKLEIPEKSDRKVYVAGSIGSYGACLHDGSEYRGEYISRVSKDTLKAWHRPRMAALVAAGVDYLAMETLPALAEAEALVDLLKEFPNQKAWVSFTCKEPGSTVFGDDIATTAKKLWSMNRDQVVAVGVNCLHPSLVTPLITSIAEVSKRNPIPTIAYPNNGDKYDVALKKWIKEEGSPPLESYVPQWLNAGIHILGGCCKTTADDIEKFKKYVDKRNDS